jgi:hypothetical protein
MCSLSYLRKRGQGFEPRSGPPCAGVRVFGSVGVGAQSPKDLTAAALFYGGGGGGPEGRGKYLP